VARIVALSSDQILREQKLLCGGFLLGKLGVEGFFLLRDVLFVAIGIDEWIRRTFFHSWVLFFQAEAVAVGSEEDVAGERFQDAPLRDYQRVEDFVLAGALILDHQKMQMMEGK